MLEIYEKDSPIDGEVYKNMLMHVASIVKSAVHKSGVIEIRSTQILVPSILFDSGALHGSYVSCREKCKTAFAFYYLLQY
jgi:hypothetical protein